MLVGQLRDELAEAVTESARAEGRYCLPCYFAHGISSCLI